MPNYTVCGLFCADYTNGCVGKQLNVRGATNSANNYVILTAYGSAYGIVAQIQYVYFL